MRELSGSWCRGEGEAHDFLFDPQFALTNEDHLMCKGLAKGLDQSRYQRDSEIMWQCHWKGPAEGGDKGKGKGKQLAVGSKGKDELEFRNRVVQRHHDSSWQNRAGIAVTLPQLFLSLGRKYTAAELYGYFNTLESLCITRLHAWARPVRQAASIERASKGRGRGFR